MGGRQVRGRKEQGEWAELAFMTRATEEGLHVSKPYGDSLRYDVAVEFGGRFLKVQVKSTAHRWLGKDSYRVNLIMAPGRKYQPGSVDFFAIYLIPINTWYIIPYWALGPKVSLLFTPGGHRARYENFREAWHLMKCGGCREKCTRTREPIRVKLR
jgi:hypothetical protein